MEIRRLEPSAGAQWLLGALRLFGRSPAGFGLLALSYTGLWLFVMFAVKLAPVAAAPLQLAFFLIGPLLLAGMIFAAHEVDQGRPATPRHLLAAFRGGKAGRLISTLLPQIALMLFCVILLYAMLGTENMNKLLELFAKLQAQAENKVAVDPAEFASLPFGRMLLWLAMVFAAGLVAFFFTFTVVPDMLFTDVGLVRAMARSYRACMTNLVPMLVFAVLGFVLIFATSFLFAIFSSIAGLIAGEAGMLVSTGIFNGFMAAFAAAVMYFAWKQMLGNDTDIPAEQPPVTGIEV